MTFALCGAQRTPSKLGGSPPPRERVEATRSRSRRVARGRITTCYMDAARSSTISKPGGRSRRAMRHLARGITAAAADVRCTAQRRAWQFLANRERTACAARPAATVDFCASKDARTSTPACVETRMVDSRCSAKWAHFGFAHVAVAYDIVGLVHDGINHYGCRECTVRAPSSGCGSPHMTRSVPHWPHTHALVHTFRRPCGALTGCPRGTPRTPTAVIPWTPSR